MIVRLLYPTLDLTMQGNIKHQKKQTIKIVFHIAIKNVDKIIFEVILIIYNLQKLNVTNTLTKKTIL